LEKDPTRNKDAMLLESKRCRLKAVRRPTFSAFERIYENCFEKSGNASRDISWL